MARRVSHCGIQRHDAARVCSDGGPRNAVHELTLTDGTGLDGVAVHEAPASPRQPPDRWPAVRAWMPAAQQPAEAVAATAFRPVDPFCMAHPGCNGPWSASRPWAAGPPSVRRSLASFVGLPVAALPLVQALDGTVHRPWRAAITHRARHHHAHSCWAETRSSCASVAGGPGRFRWWSRLPTCQVLVIYQSLQPRLIDLP